MHKLAFILTPLILVGVFILINWYRYSKVRVHINYDVTFCIYANGQMFNGKRIDWLKSKGGHYKDNLFYIILPRNKAKSLSKPDVKKLIECKLDNQTGCHGMYGSVVDINTIKICRL